MRHGGHDRLCRLIGLDHAFQRRDGGAALHHGGGAAQYEAGILFRAADDRQARPFPWAAQPLAGTGEGAGAQAPGRALMPAGVALIGVNFG